MEDAAETDAARAREGEGGVGDDVCAGDAVAGLGVLPEYGEVECEFGGTGGTARDVSATRAGRLWLGIEEGTVAVLRLVRRTLVDTEGLNPNTGRAPGAKGLSTSGGGVGR